MRRLFFVTLGIATFLAAGTFLSALAQSSSQESVAEAARKARAKKKAAPPSAKVVTNDDLSSGLKPPAAAGTGQPTPADAAGAASAAAEPGDSAGEPDASAAKKDAKGEEYWRRRFAEARQQLARAEREFDILQREEDRQKKQYYSDPTKAMKEEYERTEINERAGKIEAKRKEVAQLRQALADLEDELRRAGGDSGWAR